MTLPFCFFTLGQLVSWLLQVQILLQFIWQCAAVILLRRYRPDVVKPFRMWLYPLPALVSLAMWIYIFLSAPLAGIVFSVAFLVCGRAYLSSTRRALRLCDDADAVGRLLDDAEGAGAPRCALSGV